MKDYSSDPRYEKIYKVITDNIKNKSIAHWLSYMACLFGDKDADYSGSIPFSNIRSCEKIGIPAKIGLYIRIMDKRSRLDNYFKNNIQSWMKGESESTAFKIDENAVETLIDEAVYNIIEAVLLEEPDIHIIKNVVV